ncbi:response regulator transcription factor [Anaeromassilibacillus sp. An200]|uniref:Stage 0 sporulation protein A homolog n=1 Tax=Candidatus Caccousia stercoris TaxID=2840723 RepID=A0A9D1FTU9_9FIRM|nr:response regulator transcription factor [Anaeromassilibacillus sp. An200]OUP12695.1 DNA-binding response regulator [Anaeromassilibacillus sp. An200]HIS79697.1 response regulator transcription factor [Candidatus Caccousia stercoris]
MKRNGKGGETTYRILIVEDDPGIAGAIVRQAALWELEARCVQDFRAVLEEFQAYAPHLVVMDISLPFFNGYHWCTEIRRTSRVPILFLSSASDNMNIVMAMNLGADDFIAKPFDANVLMAKLQALLRRAYDFSQTAPVLECRGAVLDTGSQTLTFDGQAVTLTKNEYRVLLTLMENRGKVVSRERLMERLWETDSFVDDNTLTVNVNRLRKKLDTAGLSDFISTKFGVGYLIS